MWARPFTISQSALSFLNLVPMTQMEEHASIAGASLYTHNVDHSSLSIETWRKGDIFESCRYEQNAHRPPILPTSWSKVSTYTQFAKIYIDVFLQQMTWQKFLRVITSQLTTSTSMYTRQCIIFSKCPLPRTLFRRPHWKRVPPLQERTYTQHGLIRRF